MLSLTVKNLLPVKLSEIFIYVMFEVLGCSDIFNVPKNGGLIFQTVCNKDPK